jgi:hypothetical protein
MYRALGDADAPDDGQPDQNADPATGDRSQ